MRSGSQALSAGFVVGGAAGDGWTAGLAAGAAILLGLGFTREVVAALASFARFAAASRFTSALGAAPVWAGRLLSAETAVAAGVTGVAN